MVLDLMKKYKYANWITKVNFEFTKSHIIDQQNSGKTMCGQIIPFFRVCFSNKPPQQLQICARCTTSQNSAKRSARRLP
jgi:hypothetical protein